MTNSFCKMLSGGLFITDKDVSKKLNFKPCCYFKEGSFEIEREKWNNIKEWVPQCESCKNKEREGQEKSLRSFSNLTSLSSNKLFHLEIDYSNACNAACGMCSPMESSRIAKIMREEKVNISTPKVKREDFFSTIKDLDLSEVQYVKFRGGEPFYIDFHMQVIDLIIKSIPNLNNVSLFYQTNGSIFPDKDFWDIAKRFKEIRFSFSIDAVGKRFNYIRSGLSWDIVSENVQKIITKESNIIGNIQCTYNPLNLFYHDEIFHYSMKMKKLNKSFSFFWHPCRRQWDISNTTPALREILKKKYNNIFSEILDVNPFNEISHQAFVRNLTLHEKRFGLSGIDTFPEIWKVATSYAQLPA